LSISPSMFTFELLFIMWLCIHITFGPLEPVLVMLPCPRHSSLGPCPAFPALNPLSMCVFLLVLCHFRVSSLDSVSASQ
jgi:hypothetical protein